VIAPVRKFGEAQTRVSVVEDESRNPMQPFGRVGRKPPGKPGFCGATAKTAQIKKRKNQNKFQASLDSLRKKLEKLYIISIAKHTSVTCSVKTGVVFLFLSCI